MDKVYMAKRNAGSSEPNRFSWVVHWLLSPLYYGKNNHGRQDETIKTNEYFCVGLIPAGTSTVSQKNSKLQYILVIDYTIHNML